MRSRWEERDKAEEALDEPVTITQRQLHSLTRNARAGLLGILLGVIAIGLSAWSLFAGLGRPGATEPEPATSPASAEMTQGVQPGPAASAVQTPVAQPVTTPPAATATPAKPTARLAEATPAKAPSRKRTATKAVKAEDVRTPISIPMPEITPDSAR